MCEFCVKHGEGKKWYLNVQNYSLDLVSDIKRKKFIKDFNYWLKNAYNYVYKPFNLLAKYLPPTKPLIKSVMKRMYIHKKWGQVIPIEDAEKILSFTNSIVAVPCICKKLFKGKEEKKCLLITLDPKSAGLAGTMDMSLFSGPDVSKFEKMDKSEAMNFMRKFEKQGGFHSVYTFRTPFIGAICNCNGESCLALKMVREKWGALSFRSEYVIRIDKDRCVGCKTCIEICPFEALKYDVTNKRAYVDYKKCHGCGVCRTACSKGAHSLQDRHLVPTASKLW